AKDFDPMAFDFGAVEKTTETGRSHDSWQDTGVTNVNPTEGGSEPSKEQNTEAGSPHSNDAEGFPTPCVSTAEILKFLIDRTSYIKQLEEEDTPKAYYLNENLRELIEA